MTKLFIVIKRKGSKRYLGAIPTKPRATPKSLRRLVSNRIKSGFSARIVTASQLKRIIMTQKPRSSKKTSRKRMIRGRKKR